MILTSIRNRTIIVGSDFGFMEKTGESLMPRTQKYLREFNSIVRESDELYRDAARAMGMPDSAFWILYALREADGMLTQRDLGQVIYLPKQTINTALKKLEQAGMIALKPADDRRSKYICLTEQGCVLASETVDWLSEREEHALAALTDSECEDFLRLYRKYNNALRQELKLSGLTEERKDSNENEDRDS